MLGVYGSLFSEGVLSMSYLIIVLSNVHGVSSCLNASVAGGGGGGGGIGY